MIVIGLSDIHGETAFIHRLGHVLKSADVVLLAGDITHFAHAGEAARVLEAVWKSAARVLTVPGNCDHPDVDSWMEKQGINLHPGVSVVGDLGFAGLGGSIYTPFNTPFEYSETRARQFLADIAEGLPEEIPFVMLSHQPPRDTLCDRLRDGRHVGSIALREFIEIIQPLVCFTGHIHESVGIDRIGKTWIINPGRLGHGRYAYAEITVRQAFVEICPALEKRAKRLSIGKAPAGQ